MKRISAMRTLASIVLAFLTLLYGSAAYAAEQTASDEAWGFEQLMDGLLWDMDREQMYVFESELGDTFVGEYTQGEIWRCAFLYSSKDVMFRLITYTFISGQLALYEEYIDISEMGEKATLYGMAFLVSSGMALTEQYGEGTERDPQYIAGVYKAAGVAAPENILGGVSWKLDDGTVMYIIVVGTEPDERIMFLFVNEALLPDQAEAN